MMRAKIYKPYVIPGYWYCQLITGPSDKLGWVFRTWEGAMSFACKELRKYHNEHSMAE
jgi:hypothetical protein